MNALTVTDLAVSPWGTPLLRDINLGLPEGRILALIGPNGAGKSTLLHTLAGGLTPTAGTVALQDKPLAQWPRLERARALALLPQQSTLSFPFPVEDVVRLGRSPHVNSAAEEAQVLQEAMRATDVLAFRQRPYTTLSGGERQRVQLARVLAQVWRACDSPTRVLLLDEPTTGLDLEHQLRVADAIRELARSGCSTVLALHDFNLAASLADQVLVLAGGSSVGLGTPQKIFTQDMFREVFRVDVHIGQHPSHGSPLVIQP